MAAGVLRGARRRSAASARAPRSVYGITEGRSRRWPGTSARLCQPDADKLATRRSRGTRRSGTDSGPRHRVAGMPMLCLAGTFRILSTEPDGDSIRFYPDDPAPWARVPGPNAVRTNAGGGAQLRLDGIDALETHYSPRGGGPLHQPIDLAHQARDELLRWLGFRDMQRTGETVDRRDARAAAGLPAHARGRRLRPLRGAGRARRPARAQRDAGDGQGRRPAQDGQPPAHRHGPRLPDLLPQALSPTCAPSSPSSRARRATPRRACGPATAPRRASTSRASPR